MKRTFLSLALAGLLSSMPTDSATAHWGRWSCGSYSGGYTYYYPRYYYPSYNYNGCSTYYGNYGYGNYGSYYGGYAPYPNYGFNTGYGNFGLGGNNLLGLLAGNGLAGANLSGSLLQPSYLSMPVSMGYGPAGFLQIPLGNPAGRATYLQIPVNTGYGPSSYLQIELGHGAGSNTPATPTPSATPNVPPFGAVPGAGGSLTSQYTFDTPKTSSRDVPMAVASAGNESASGIAFSLTTSSAAAAKKVEEPDAMLSATEESGGIQFVSLTRQTEVPRKETHVEAAAVKDTSFSLMNTALTDKTEKGREPEVASTWEKMALSATHEKLPWQVK